MDNIVHTYIKLSTLSGEELNYSPKTLFTFLTESVDNIVHTGIKLSIFLFRIQTCMNLHENCMDIVRKYGHYYPHIDANVHSFWANLNVKLDVLVKTPSI